MPFFNPSLDDMNKEVRRIAGVSLDTIMDHDEEWAIQIRRLKFETYNREWLEATDEGDAMPHEHQHEEAQDAYM